VSQVEQRLARDKQLRRRVAEAGCSLRPLLFRQLDWIRVKGRTEPVAVYELLGEAAEARRYAELLELFDTGLRAYRGQQWQAAIEIFESILQRYPDDGPAGLLAARCRQYEQQPPPSDWDGVFVMKTK
jgi:adenylate cyclase